MQLNKIGQKLAQIEGVKAMTDVTGFGLLGHLVEMCEGSQLSAEIELSKIPLLPKVEEYLEQGCVPGGTHRNWSSYGKKVQLKNDADKLILCDPQTSGGIMIAVAPEAIKEVQEVLQKEGFGTTPFGKLVEQKSCLVEVL